MDKILAELRAIRVLLERAERRSDPKHAHRVGKAVGEAIMTTARGNSGPHLRLEHDCAASRRA